MLELWYVELFNLSVTSCFIFNSIWFNFCFCFCNCFILSVYVCVLWVFKTSRTFQTIFPTNNAKNIKRALSTVIRLVKRHNNNPIEKRYCINTILLCDAGHLYSICVLLKFNSLEQNFSNWAPMVWFRVASALLFSRPVLFC